MEAVELIVVSNTIAVAHADVLLEAEPLERRTDFKPTERDKQLPLSSSRSANWKRRWARSSAKAPKKITGTAHADR